MEDRRPGKTRDMDPIRQLKDVLRRAYCSRGIKTRLTYRRLKHTLRATSPYMLI